MLATDAVIRDESVLVCVPVATSCVAAKRGSAVVDQTPMLVIVVGIVVMKLLELTEDHRSAMEHYSAQVGHRLSTQQRLA